MSTRCEVRRPAVDESAHTQQAPLKLHEETWAGLLMNQGLQISQEVEIVPGCAVSVARPSCPDHSPESPESGRVLRNVLGWTLEEKTEGSGVWLFRGTLQGKNLFSSLDVTGRLGKEGSYRTARSVPCDSSCTCSYAYGRGPAVGPHTGERCWPLLAGVWRAIAALMKPWCAEGELPTAANLNLYRGWNSCVGWHCDVCLESVARGSSLCQWALVPRRFSNGRASRDGDASSCYLGHGDILVIDGQCQDEFLHCTDPGLEQERINVTFRWIRQHVSPSLLFRTGVACCLPTCAQGSSVPVMGNFGFGVFLAFWLLFGVLCIWRVLVCLFPCCVQGFGLHWCASCWTRPLGGGRWEHYLCDLSERLLGSS